jgi:YidC/Oxa1 family membrane protein insertase
MSHFLGGSFGLAIVFLTVIINLAMLPLTMSQIKSTKKMQDLQPKIAEIQKKYAKDKQKLSQEQMKLYKESGVKPAGCALTLIIQMPVWLALYQSIMLALAVAPEGLLNLAKYLYPWQVVYSSLPLSREFFTMNLADPNMILAVLVGATMWMQQKMSTAPSTDPRQASQSRMMNWMMPLLFAFMALSFPSGLSLYWVASSVFRIVLQYRLTGWGGLRKQTIIVTDSEKKYLKFDASQEKKPAGETRHEVIITDKESLKKSKGSFNLGKFLPGKNKNRQDP